MTAQGAPLIDADVPASRLPAVVGVVREYLRSSCRLILEVLGRDNVASLILSGSATRGEVTAVRLARTGVLVLSDIDLAVVMKSDCLRDRAKLTRAKLREALAKFPAASQICATPELGVYSLNDLEIQSWKMGVYEMKTSGKVLWGDTHVLDRIPSFEPDEIPRWEAVVLLFNRCLEMLEGLSRCESDDPNGAFRLLYASAKAYLDAGTSIAAHQGRFVPGYRPRLEEVRRVVDERYADGLAGFPADRLMEGLAFWTDFKIDAHLERVEQRYGLSATATSLKDAARNAFAEARVPLLRVWMALVGAEEPRPPSGVLEACASLVGREPMRMKLRGWKQVLLGRGGVSLVRAFRLVSAGSPLHLLRLCAMCALDQCAVRESAGRAGAAAPFDAPPAPAAQAVAFLNHYFPSNRIAGPGQETMARWRKRIVDVWREWTERYWS